MPDALREKLVTIIEGGWKFDPEKWAASMERHANDEPFDPSKAFTNAEPIESKYPMGEIFMQFDTDGDGVLNESEYAPRAARVRRELGGGAACPPNGRAPVDHHSLTAACPRVAVVLQVQARAARDRAR